MRKVIEKKTAIRIVVLLFALICIVSVWPLRVWSNVVSTTPGGNLTDNQEYIDYEYSVMQKFITQYDRLSSVDVYVTEMTRGRYISVTLMDVYYGEKLKVFVDTEGMELPGYVTVPMEIDVEVGEEYYIQLEYCRSKYYVGFEDVPADSAYVGSVYYNGNELPGLHLAARYNYRMPISKKLSVMIMAGIAAVAAVLYLLVGLYYTKRPEKNGLYTMRQAVKPVANPIIVLIFGALMIMVFPLKIFDRRVIDIIFYELGLAITAAFCLYAVNHKPVKRAVGVSFWDTMGSSSNKLIYVLIMLSMSMAIWYACEYMNDLYDIYHTMSERKMLIWLLVMMILTFSYKEAFNLINLLWVVVSGIYGINYYRVNVMADTEKEYDLHNAILKYGIIIVILGGIVVINLIRLLIGVIRNRKQKSQIRITPYGVLTLVFLISIIVMRNTRWWGVALAVTFTCLYIRVAASKYRKDWFKIVAGGIMMNFGISLVFCLLHRYFAGYVSGRYGFLFHTVTVTAEYFTFMEAVAAVLLVAKVVALPKGIGIKEVFFSAWKEIILFGWISAYAIFTVSRTAYLAIAVCVLTVLIIANVLYKKQFFRMLAAMLVAVIICFPAAFTMQRIIPTVVAEPVIYPIDDTDEFVRGGAAWDNPNFMCVERFVNLFESKILGMEVGDYDYPADINNYDINGTGDPIYDIYGHPYEGSDEQQQFGYNIVEPDGNLLVSASFTQAEAALLLLTEQINEYVDSSNILDVLSNGRITIFNSYLKVLNMTGHDEMGAELPNGEIAVHAHNTYIQVAYDHGIPVGILFAAFIMCGLVAGVVYYKKNHKEEPLALIPFAVIMGFAVAGISEWVFAFSNPMTVALMVAIAPLLYKENK